MADEDNNINPELCCRVCGLPQAEPPWGEDGKTPNFTICECCGTEFGYEDCTEEATQRSRQRWLENGAQWSESRAKPQDWNLEEQLRNLA